MLALSNMTHMNGSLALNFESSYESLCTLPYRHVA